MIPWDANQAPSMDDAVAEIERLAAEIAQLRLRRHAGSILPARFTLTIEEHPSIGWIITSDAHRGFMQAVMPEEGLPEGLRQVPGALREILVAQKDEDRRMSLNTPPAPPR